MKKLLTKHQEAKVRDRHDQLVKERNMQRQSNRRRLKLNVREPMSSQ